MLSPACGSLFYLLVGMVICKYPIYFLEEGYSLLSLALPLQLKLLYLFIGMVIRKYHCIPHNLPNFVHRNLHWEGKSHLQGEG